MHKIRLCILAGLLSALTILFFSIYALNDGGASLIRAAVDGDLRKTRQLLDSEANVHYQDGWSGTALMYAVVNGHLEIVKELMAAGAHINERSRHNRTPLMHAAKHGHTDIVIYLIQYGADISLVDRNGMSAADLAEKEKADSIPKRNTG